MRSNTPVYAALAIAVLALIVALWSALGGSDPDDAAGRPALAARPAGGVLLKDRALPGAPAGTGDSGKLPGNENPPPAPPAGGETTAGAGGSGADQAERARRALAEARAAARVAASQRASGAGFEDPAVEPAGGIGGGAPEEPPPPTFDPGSIYDGLSQDDLLELFLAMRRLRDAGVFQKLTPEQYAKVAQLLPDMQGVQDANEITQRILGMGVGEWLDHERGPKGRFVLQ